MKRGDVSTVCFGQPLACERAGLNALNMTSKYATLGSTYGSLVAADLTNAVALIHVPSDAYSLKQLAPELVRLAEQKRAVDIVFVTRTYWQRVLLRRVCYGGVCRVRSPGNVFKDLMATNGQSNNAFEIAGLVLAVGLCTLAIVH